jgi:hypothetical protein
MIIGDSNIDMFDQNLTQPNELNFFIDHYSMKFQLKNQKNLWHYMLVTYW